MSPENNFTFPKENRSTFEMRLETFSAADRAKIEKAYDRAKKAHRKQRRFSGKRYFEHLRGVALILLDECGITNASIICAALLHDTLEDTITFGDPTKLMPTEFNKFSVQSISHSFGPKTAKMVFSVTKPYVDGKEVKNKTQAKKIKHDRLRDASEEALLVGMADRLHNLRDFFPKGGERTPKRKIKETEEILIPIFKRAAGKYPAETQYLLAEINKAILVLKAKT